MRHHSYSISDWYSFTLVLDEATAINHLGEVGPRHTEYVIQLNVGMNYFGVVQV
jgi:hypothetical protein